MANFKVTLTIEGITKEQMDVAFNNLITLIDTIGGTAGGGFALEEESDAECDCEECDCHEQEQ